MAQTDLLRRLLDAGVAFTEMTRARAESIVQDLVRAGELGVDQVQSTVQELVDRSRQNTENLVAAVRNEVTSQLGAASAEHVQELEQRLEALEGTRGGAARGAKKAAAKKRAPARKATARKATAKKATAKRAAVKQTPPARKAAAKKAVAPRGT